LPARTGYYMHHDKREREQRVTTYRFSAVVEPDEGQWYAYCPALVRQGGATWGETREQALANLEEVIGIVIASMLEHGDPLPTTVCEPEIASEPLISVTV
jgi:predicted RNase H-like HicB family nuclease